KHTCIPHWTAVVMAHRFLQTRTSRMGFTVAVASAGAFTLVFDWSLAGPETSSWAYERGNRGAHTRRLQRRFFDCRGEFRMDFWLLHHIHSPRHLVLDCAGNFHV